MRIIECGVKSEFITGDEIVIGAAGSHDDVYIELTFSKEWENTTKTISWTNAMGEDPIMLTIGTQHIVDLWERRYKVAIPYEAKEYAGEVKMSIKGVIVRDGIEEVAVTTNEATFTVLESNWDDDMQHAQDITPTNAEIFQAQLDSMAEDIILAGKAGEYAASAQESADEAAVSASTAKKSEEGAILNSSDAEAWALGTRGGVPVGIDDEAYQNNAKWYKDLAGEIAGGDFVTVEEAAAMFNEVKDLANEAQAAANTAQTAADNAQETADAAQDSADEAHAGISDLNEKITMLLADVNTVFETPVTAVDIDLSGITLSDYREVHILIAGKVGSGTQATITVNIIVNGSINTKKDKHSYLGRSSTTFNSNYVGVAHFNYDENLAKNSMVIYTGYNTEPIQQLHTMIISQNGESPYFGYREGVISLSDVTGVRFTPGNNGAISEVSYKILGVK